ncbi:MAG: hypothetical protein DU480_05245 [Nitrosomonas sp.]|uniref:hypothetical protein n=1 Tax=Nitrosomonas sp. TaxID=42353 RepID=UPI0032F0906C
MKNGYEIITTPRADGTIVQETIDIENDVRRTVAYEIIDTRDAQIRKALIALGWTPPVIS